MSDPILRDRLAAIETATAGERIPGPASPGGFRRIGLRVPEVRAMVKKGYAVLEALSRTEQLRTWHFVYNNTSLFEVGSQAIYTYQHRSLTRTEAARVAQWVSRCDCWEHSDDLSKIYAQVFEENPDWMIGRFEKWNTSKDPWKRRQSVVGLLEYTGKRKRVPPFELLVRFVVPLLSDEAYYVQKGVGWTLREIGNVYPEETGGFLDEHCTAISPVAWSAATEKLSARVKTRLNGKRKAHRIGMKEEPS